ncbi:pilus assembly protein FimV [Pseudomonas fluvialis]|uniref:Pilus assembly protein FimV n=1 Tax=Pseudomonas fluvialis TaxID=1793966 RepID=A0A7X0BRJ5_9PSED|nr:FimV/HubP family polar landmark protein [Pseudomonas fluvialis]MBB6341123.1 pilus assembly protein FimV [Pseudomonas fluvialis]
MRTLLFTLASSSVLCPGAAMALGLGEITLYSALNQPLDARIELIDASQLEADEFKVRLASEQAFARAGVERFYVLNDLRFTPVLQGGERYIRVQSNKVMREPYLNFLVEVVRPNGHFVREFTVLFDPPESSAYRQQAAPLTSLAPRIEQPVRSRISVPQVLPTAMRGERYQVRRGDSLWLIAKRLQQAGSTLSLQRLMDGILALNPQAFMGGDASRLKADVELLLPDEARPFASAESPAPVADTSVEAPASAPVEVAAEAAAPLAEPVPAATVATETQAVAQLQQRLDSELQANQQQNAELMAQLQTLSQQLNTLQQAVSQRDQQIAELQQRLQQTTPAAATAAPSAADAAVAETPVAETPPAAAAPAPASISAETPSTWHWWLASSLLLGALVTAGWLRRGKRQAHAAAPTPTPRAVVVPPPQQPPRAAPLPPVQAPAEQLAPVTPARNSDALAAANVYIAYGNFAEARACLRQALEQDPERHELRLRLLEVLAQLGDEVGFKRELAVLQSIPECATPLARIREQYAQQSGGKPTEVVHEAVAPLNEASPLLEDDFKLNLEDLPLDADWDQIEPFQTVRPVSKGVEEDSLIGSNLNELPEVFEMGHSELTELPQAFERRTSARPVVVEEDEEVSPWGREPVGKTLSEFRSFEESHDLSHLEGKREHLSQLNQALAYIEQGNLDEACNILNQLISDGSDEQKREAKALLSRIA